MVKWKKLHNKGEMIMRVSANTSSLTKRFSTEEAIRRYAKAGFDCLDFSISQPWGPENPAYGDDYLENARRIRAAADECGIPFNQAHAPFRFSVEESVNWETEIFPKQVRALEICAILGVEILVIHPIHHMDFRGNEKILHDINMAYFKKLIPYAEKYNVKIAIENMWRRDPNRKFISHDTCSQPEEHAAWIDELNHPNIVACLDLGHSALVGVEPEDAIRYLGADRLKSLHVHDVDYISDLHTLPFQGKTNWMEITKALKDIGYQGDLTYEAGTFLQNYPDELLDSPLRFMVETGRILISLIEG